ncbi:MAG: hypothetical protein QHC79_09640 [Pseudosphingobacterium sp.]|nr:hypothetical protein [Pseudosphingobacterium sp.]
MGYNEKTTGIDILKLQEVLRRLLFVRPYDLPSIESTAINLCDKIVDYFENDGESALKTKIEHTIFVAEKAIQEAVNAESENKKIINAFIEERNENERLREALEWYADRKNYVFSESRITPSFAKVLETRAKEALGRLD